MAILKNGIFGPVVGKLGNVVGYIRMGQALVRAQPRKKSKKNKKRTPAQMAASSAFALVSGFVTPINQFINEGFKLDTAGTARVPRNAAMSYNMAAVTGQYPEQTFDYAKGIVTAGKLNAPENALAILSEYDPTEKRSSLQFSWAVDPTETFLRNRDQVMMLAFYPETRSANFCLSGARRNEGTDLLIIHPNYEHEGTKIKQTYVETYVAFIADNRESISKSVYTGRIFLTS